MALTAEQRRQINKANAQKSTGPRTDAGKAKVRQNAVKHGMRAEVLILPDEDPAAIAARHQEWNDYYDPQSPAARHLVNQCVRATILADRVDQQHHEAISRQVREAHEAWDRDQVDQVEALKETFLADPGRATRLLRRSSLGCAWMIECWERLQGSLAERGGWEPFEQAEAFRLMGDRPPAGPLPRMDPEILRALAAQELEALRAERDRLWNDLEAPDRAGAPGRALILRDPTEARLFFRYHAEARCTFHRAWRDLVKVLESDAAVAEAVATAEAAGAVAPNHDASAAPASEAGDPVSPSPNKANGPEAKDPRPRAAATEAPAPKTARGASEGVTGGDSPNKANSGPISRGEQEFGPAPGAGSGGVADGTGRSDGSPNKANGPASCPSCPGDESVPPNGSPNKANAPAPGASRQAA